MKIGQGGYRRTPWWCWAVALVAAVAVLPGAALVISAGEPKDSQPAPLRPDAYAVPANSAPVSSAPGGSIVAGGDKTPSDTIYQTYSVENVLSKIREERGLSEPAAKNFLKEQAENPWVPPVPGRNQRRDPSNVDWYGDQLVVGATAEGHKRLAKTLDAFRKFGITEIVVDVRFLTIGDKVFQEVLPESTISSLNVGEAGLANSDAVEPASFDRPLGSHEGAHVARAQLLIEKDSPMRFRVVDKEQGEKLIDRCQADKRSNMIQAPKVTLFNGQTAFVYDTSQSPFVVGLTTPVEPNVQQPQIRVVTEGTRLQLRAIADQSGAVHLDFAATFSVIQKVETMSVPRNAGGMETASFARNAGGKADTTIQIPKVATIRLEGGAALKPGQWLLLSGSDITDQMTATSVEADWPISWIYGLVDGWKHPKPHETYSLVMMLQAEKIDTPNPKRIE